MDVRTTPQGETHQKELTKYSENRSRGIKYPSLFYPGGIQNWGDGINRDTGSKWRPYLNVLGRFSETSRTAVAKNN